MTDIFEHYGYAISDRDGDLRDISAVIEELEDIQINFSTLSMNSGGAAAFLQGKAEMLAEIIQYLRRV